MKKTTTRLISIGAGAVRSFCTASVEGVKPKPYPTPMGLGGAQSNMVSKNELFGCVKQFRDYNQDHQPLELMDWMEKRDSFWFYSDYALRINLLSKVKGIESAEQYFNILPPSAKNKTYGALLNCYCKEKMEEKALALFTEMSELDIASTTVTYNTLMSLYVLLGEPEKVFPLVQEMKEKNILLSTYTYNILITCYASLKDIDGAESVLKEMETKDGNGCEWTTYGNLAAIYVKAGIFEKAELALKKFEKNMDARDQNAFHILISLYAGTSNASEVHRVWKSLKSSFPSTSNRSYLVMLQALAKMDDINGLVKCYMEWESSCSVYDMRLTNVLLHAYRSCGMTREVKFLCEDAIEKYSKEFKYPYDRFMDYFWRNRKLDKALRCLEAGASTIETNKLKPRRGRESAFLKLFEEEKDVAGAEKFGDMMSVLFTVYSQETEMLMVLDMLFSQE